MNLEEVRECEKEISEDVKEAHVQLEKLANGRNEGEIGLGEKYWPFKQALRNKFFYAR